MQPLEVIWFTICNLAAVACWARFIALEDDTSSSFDGPPALLKWGLFALWFILCAGILSKNEFALPLIRFVWETVPQRGGSLHLLSVVCLCGVALAATVATYIMAAHGLLVLVRRLLTARRTAAGHPG